MISAKSYDDSTNNTMEAPLLEQHPSDEEEQETQEYHTCLNMSCFFLSVLVGVFVQFSTFGVIHLVITKWGEDELNASKDVINMISALCSFFTSSFAIVILFLRNVILASYRGVNMDHVMLHVECLFAVGALVGVCSAWAFTDYMLGMLHQCVYSVATLALSLLCFRLMLWLFTPAVDDAVTKPQRSPEVLVVV